jgi:hypothetical protein
MSITKTIWGIHQQQNGKECETNEEFLQEKRLG